MFQAKDKRRLYCSSSCNTMACQARKTTKSTKTSQLPLTSEVDGQTLPLSAQNIATLTVGAGVAAGLNYLANDRPAHAEIMSTLHEIKGLLEKLTSSSQSDQVLDYIISYIDAQRRVDVELSNRMRQAHQQREQQRQQKAQAAEATKEKLFAKLKRPRSS
ncbi:hypothetical protein LC612_30305 [Nostoc sp. CHAB 5834]|nr:hypothetical protein [Nostoc sp. CHAB 5834]